jgi:small-conductance mechanosensitive channel
MPEIGSIRTRYPHDWLEIKTSGKLFHSILPGCHPGIVATPLPGNPVRFNGKTLFYVYERLGPLSPDERAALIAKKVNQLADDPFAPQLDITLAESDQGTDLIINGVVLLTVTDADARVVNMDRTQAAQTAAQLVEQAIQDYRQQNTALVRVERFLIAIGILVALVVILYVLNRFFKRRLENLKLTSIQADKVDGSSKGDFFQTRLWRRLLRLFYSLGRVVVILIVIFFVLPVLLRIFPRTAEIANQIFSLITGVLSAVWVWFGENRSSFFTILVIVAVTYGLTRLIKAFFDEIESGTIRLGGFDPEWAPFTRRIVNFLLIIAAVIVTFPYIPGSDSDVFRGITIFLGALFTLSSTAAVTNIVAGVIQTYTGAFRNGDMVRIADVTGIVIEKRMLTTRILTPKQEEVSIPNSLVLSNSVVNYSALARSSGLVLYTTITIGYDVPWRTVHNLLLSAAANTPDLLTDPQPFVLQTSLNDYHISYQLNVYTGCADIMPRIYSALHQNILDVFNEAGVEIMSPAFTALRDGNVVTIPEENRTADYQAPGFRIAKSQ